MAQRLTEQGDSVEHLFLIDTTIIGDDEPRPEGDGVISERVMAMYELFNMFRRFSGKSGDARFHARLSSMNDTEQKQWLSEALGSDASLLPGSAAAHVLEVYLASFSAMKRYRPLPYAGLVTLFRATDGFPAESLHPARRIRTHFGESFLGWQHFCSALRVVVHDGDHFSIVLHPHAIELANAVTSTLDGTKRIDIGLHQLVSTKHFHDAGRPIDISQRGVSFDPFHPALLDDPYPILHQLREHAPVYRDATSTWWVSRYADVSAGLRDRRFSVDTRNTAEHDKERLNIITEGARPSLGSAWFRQQEDLPLSKLYNNFLLFIDPPRHQRIRRTFSPLFESSTIKRWKDGIDRRVEDLIAEMRLRRDPDVVRDLALPLPVSVISDMLGTPEQDAFILQSWAHELFRGFDPMLSGNAAQRINTAAEDFTRYMNEHIDRRRRSPPRKDMLGLLLATQEGQSLTTDELAANCMLLFAAGFETTTSVIASSVLALLRHPDQLSLLREKPGLIENAVDEFLRYDGALRVAARVALEDVEVGGATVPRGDSVIFVLSAANRDPDAFPDPDRLDVTRNAKHHVAFAHGIHYCLGAPLARLEIQSAISALIHHDFTLVPGTIKWRESVIFRCLDRLRIAFC
jgi:cytochrome P450/thioesterase domain-containing protein